MHCGRAMFYRKLILLLVKIQIDVTFVILYFFNLKMA